MFNVKLAAVSQSGHTKMDFPQSVVGGGAVQYNTLLPQTSHRRKMAAITLPATFTANNVSLDIVPLLTLAPILLLSGKNFYLKKLSNIK